ncbi:MAG: hypothetical protein FJ263_05355 [Planctomycetes bacterium]|nr:hypothetical protein [Planctomycetota bacterium]
MNPEKPAQEMLDADILQCRADILRAVQQTAQKNAVPGNPQPMPAPPAEKKATPLSPAPVADAPEITASDIPRKIEAVPAVKPQAAQPQKTYSEPSAEAEKELQTQIASLRQQLAAKNTDIQTLAAKTRQALENLSTLQNELQNTRNTLQTAQTEKQTLQTKIRTMQEQLAAREEEIQTAAGKDSSVQQTISSLREQIEDLRDNLQNTQQELQEKQHLVERLSEAVKQQKQTLEQKEPLEAQNIQLKSRLDLLEKQDQQLQDQLKQIGLASADLNKDIQSLQNQNEQKQLELTETQAQLNVLLQERQQLLAEMENQKQQAQTMLAETQQKEKQLARQAEQLQTHLAEMENQLRELSEQAAKEKTELQTLVQDYQARLEKTDRQKREMENRLAALQAHNDRLLAGEQEAEQLREQLRQAQQKNEVLNRQLERLKGDHQLVGEENNHLHHLLHLRDQELERVYQQIKELSEKPAQPNKTEVFVSPEEMEMLHGSPQTPQATETAEERPEIPGFNLAEQIMAEHRKAVASQRQAPAARPHANKKDSVQKVVNQFVGSTESTRTTPPPHKESEVLPVSDAAEITPPAESLGSAKIDSSPNETLIAEIVRRDISQFLEAKKQAFQKTDWMWKSN